MLDYIQWIIEKAREFQENIYLCFIDYRRAFDTHLVHSLTLVNIIRTLSALFFQPSLSLVSVCLVWWVEMCPSKRCVACPVTCAKAIRCGWKGRWVCVCVCVCVCEREREGERDVVGQVGPPSPHTGPHRRAPCPGYSH